MNPFAMRVWPKAPLFSGGREWRLLISSVFVATCAIATPSFAEWIDEGDQDINGTEVHTTIYHDRGYAVFSNDCGSQRLSQEELEDGAIPSDIIPCPRDSDGPRSSSGASSPPPGQLSNAQCNKLSGDFNYLMKDKPMPAEFKRFLLNQMYSIDTEMFSIEEPEKACGDVTVYRSIRRQTNDLERQLVTGCGDRINITDGNGARIDAGNIDERIRAEEASIDTDSARICRVAQQQLAARAKEAKAPKPETGAPAKSAKPALALSPAIKQCLTKERAADPAQSIDDLTSDELMALCEDYPAVKAAGFDTAFAAYDSLRRSGGLSTPRGKSAAAPGGAGVPRGSGSPSSPGKVAAQNCIEPHYTQAGAWYSGSFKNECPVPVEFVFESCGNGGDGPDCGKTTTSLPGNTSMPVSSYRMEPKLLSERAAGPFQPRK